MSRTLATNWWTLVLRGIVAVAFGILAFTWPLITLGVLVVLFGAYVFIDGVLAFLAAFGVRRLSDRPWWMLTLEGIAGVGIGILTFFWPGITALALLYLFAAWALLTGIFEILAAFWLRKEIKGEWLMGLSGSLSVLFGLAAAFLPLAGLLAVVWMVGAYAIAFGIMLFSLGIRLRSAGVETHRRSGADRFGKRPAPVPQ